MAHWPSATQWSLSAGGRGNERDLVRAARLGDKEAFQQLIFRYDRLVLAFSLHVTRSEEEARRIYERVFLTAFNCLADATAEPSFFIWIYRIAARCCQEHLQKESKPSWTRHWHQSQSQKLRVERPKDARTETQLFSRLSIRERLVFVLAHYSRLRIGTIAEILNVPEVSVKNALSRAFYKLRTEKAA
jgi:RNA polymerase sigma-70 factor (ECF subfamily)